METKIKNLLAEHDLTVDDLTADEIEQLKEEIEATGKGEMFLDGVLSNPEIFYRKAMANHKEE